MDEERVRQIVREELVAREKRFSKEQVRQLIDQINQAVTDGATIIVK